jgi:hypothetical protein
MHRMVAGIPWVQVTFNLFTNMILRRRNLATNTGGGGGKIDHEYYEL